jgi:thioredoxin 1
MDRRTIIVSAAAFAALGAIPARVRAGAVVAFDPRAFAAAQAAGEGVVVFVHAPW